jgi:hypothetical protein
MRSLIISLLFLVCAALVAIPLFSHHNSPPTNLGAILAESLGNEYGPLAQPLAARYGNCAAMAAEMHGQDGLIVLDVFGEEACSLLDHNSQGFSALVSIVKLDPARFRIANGPWRKAVTE